MLSPTMARGLLGIFLRGMDPPATNQGATTPPVRSPTYSSLQAILADGARGRGARGMASGCKGSRDGGERSAGEGGRKGYGTGQPCGESEIGAWTTAARWTTAEQAQGGRGQDHRDQVISDGEVGDYRARGDNKGGINGESAEWSGADSKETEVSATEEEATTTGGAGG